MCGCDDRFGSETKLLEQQASGRAGSVVVDADDPAGVTDESRQPMPTPASIETRALISGGITESL